MNNRNSCFNDLFGELYILAWTTTPWTLPSNTGLAVGKEITYVLVKTFNPYTFTEQTVVLAKDLLHQYFPEKNARLELEDYHEGQKAHSLPGRGRIQRRST